MLRAGNSRDTAIQVGLELRGIEVSPDAFFAVILPRTGLPARGASNRCPIRPFDRDVEALFICIEIQRSDVPGRDQAKKLAIMMELSRIDGHGTLRRWFMESTNATP
jgi:hypothetical protein